MVRKKLLNNIKSILFFQSFLILFFRFTKLHNIIHLPISFFFKKTKAKTYNLDHRPDFSNLKKYHQLNCLSSELNWSLNGVNHGNYLNLTSEKKHRSDYTKQLVFSYCEWLFNDPEISYEKLAKIINYSKETDFGKERSCLSIVIYPILYARQKELLNPLFADNILENSYNGLLKSVEMEVGGNHLIDNYISLSILSIIFNDKFIFNFATFLLNLFMNQSTKEGFYAERNPTYSLGLSLRLKILCDFIEQSDFNNKPLIKKLNLYQKKLSNFPSVLINDSYLKHSALISVKGNYPKNEHSNFFYNKEVGDNIYTFIKNSIGIRGYSNHCHDASLSLFIWNTAHKKWFSCGFGTPTYADTKERTVSKSFSSYPTIDNGFSRPQVFEGSFRIVRAFKPTFIFLRSKDSFIEKKSNVEFHFHKKYIEVITRKINSKFEFFSDFKNCINVETCPIFDGIKAVNSEKSLRYDGIYNQVEAYKHIITFDHNLKIYY